MTHYESKTIGGTRRTSRPEPRSVGPVWLAWPGVVAADFAGAVISEYAKTGLPEAPRPPRTYYATLSPSLEVKQHQRGRCRPPLASEQSATPTSPANPASDPCGSQLQRRRSGQLRGT